MTKPVRWAVDPPPDCSQCTRLVEYRENNRSTHGEWFNGAVGTFGDTTAQILIVGLAPGLQGANRTGRPFTGDFAGDLLYGTLMKLKLASGSYKTDGVDTLQLVNCAITNAVRCVPPQNKPTGAEISQCNPHLLDIMNAMPRLNTLFALGRIAHEAVVRGLKLRQKDFPFSHNATHQLSDELTMVDSYHCSRYNTNTGRLTEEMFRSALGTAKSAAAT